MVVKQQNIKIKRTFQKQPDLKYITYKGLGIGLTVDFSNVINENMNHRIKMLRENNCQPKIM